MGLDGLELIMAVEEEFEVSFSDAEAFQSDTVGKLVDTIYSRLRNNSDLPCPSQQGFYVVRKHLMEICDITRSHIKPESELEHIFPISNRRNLWKKLIHSLTGAKQIWPDLERRKPYDTIFLKVIPCFSFLIIFSLFYITVPEGSIEAASLFAIAFYLLSIVFYLAYSDPITTIFPKEFNSSKTFNQVCKNLKQQSLDKRKSIRKVTGNNS